MRRHGIGNRQKKRVEPRHAFVPPKLRILPKPRESDAVRKRQRRKPAPQKT